MINNGTARSFNLSQREVDVIDCAANGMSNRMIGDELGLSHLTVKSHFARIARKMGTGRREIIVLLACLKKIIPTPTRHGSGKLSEREIDVIRLMPRCETNADIGVALFLSEDTIKTHVRRMLKKLGAHDRTQAMAMALSDRIYREQDLRFDILGEALEGTSLRHLIDVRLIALPYGMIFTEPSERAIAYVADIARGHSPDAARRRHDPYGGSRESIPDELTRCTGSSSLIRQSAMLYAAELLPKFRTPSGRPSPRSLGVMHALAFENHPERILAIYGIGPADIDRLMWMASADMHVAYIHYATLVVRAMAAGWINPFQRPSLPSPRVQPATQPVASRS